MKKIAVIGGGAAGFFAAITAKETFPDAEVVIYEKSSKLLSKVRVSGGGRCNVTHACFEVRELVKNYPRGAKELQSAFHQFFCPDTVSWFENRGVKLKTEQDGRMFPVTDNSETIVDCLMDAAGNAGVTIKLNSGINAVVPAGEGKISIVFQNGDEKILDSVIVAAGGSPTLRGFDWLAGTKHTIVEPVPSLFTFNIPDKNLNDLMGVSVEHAKVKLPALKLETTGPLLITHWGLSGPAVLKLSSLAARELAARDYHFTVQVAWIDRKENELREELISLKKNAAGKQIGNVVPDTLTKRLWEYLLYRSGILPQSRCGDVATASLNKLTTVLLYDQYEAKGKTTFKEEFVTCGGISLKEIDFRTMQSKIVPHLFFAGEVLDIDAVTGGFNFQAAWTTGFIAGKSALL